MPTPDAPPTNPVREGCYWRDELPDWSDAWRERWGKRANALEDTGLNWRQAEEQAFVEVTSERERARSDARENRDDPGRPVRRLRDGRERSEHGQCSTNETRR